MAKHRVTATHVRGLIKKMERVSALFVMYRLHRGSGKGRPQKQVSVLKQSAIVLIVACWEAYIEDLAKAAFDFLLKEAELATALPINVRVLASRPLHKDQDETQVWKLADNGWKTILQTYSDSILEKYISKGFHTPDARHIDELFLNLIGLQSLSSLWKWKGTSANKPPSSRLDKLVKDRHLIAHRLTDKTISQAYVLNSADLVQRLAARSSNMVRLHLYRLVKKAAWGEITFKGTS